MPMLTLGLGPVIERNRHNIAEELAKQVPAFDLLDLYFLPGFDPGEFNWKGSKQSKRHTYRIKDISNTEKTFSGFSSATRQQVRKAERTVAVIEGQGVETLYKMVSLTFKRQSKKTPYTLSFVKNIHEACAKKNCCKILVAKDAEGNTHGACFLAWDAGTAYYVMGGSDPKFKSSAAYSLLMWEAIKEASKHVKEFDFCGSMAPSIERFFKGFGSEQTPYFHIKKVNSGALKLVLAVKNNM